MQEEKIKANMGNSTPFSLGPSRLLTKGNNAFLLENLEGEILEFPVNGQFLKLYFQS